MIFRFSDPLWLWMSFCSSSFSLFYNFRDTFLRSRICNGASDFQIHCGYKCHSAQVLLDYIITLRTPFSGTVYVMIFLGSM